jgi:hypothetical protein
MSLPATIIHGWKGLQGKRILSFQMVSDKEKMFYKIDTLSTISLVMAGSRAMASVPLG